MSQQVRKAVLAILAIFAGLLAHQPETSSEPSPQRASWLPQLTSLTPRSTSETRPVDLRYRVSWSNLVSAGTMEASFLPEDRKPAGLVEATARLKSTGAARLLWAYDGETRSQIRRKTLLPEHFQHRQTENGIEAEYRAEYRGGIMSVESTVAPPGGAPVQRQTRYYRFNAIRDILSALAFLQNVDLPDGREIKLLVQPLDRLYLVSFAVLRRESRNVLGAPWSTIKLGVKVRGVRADLKLAPYSKMRSATIWLSDDDYRLPVEIDADLPVGFVSARLSSRNIR